MTSMATTKGAHAAVRSLCLTGRDYSDSLADRPHRQDQERSEGCGARVVTAFSGGRVLLERT